jgi:hypothetical protein
MVIIDNTAQQILTNVVCLKNEFLFEFGLKYESILKISLI